MGLLKRHLYPLAIEEKNYPIRGDVLTFGQQSVYATLDEVKALFKRQGVSLKSLAPGFDTKNKIPDWKGTAYDNYTNCQTVLTLLGAEKIYAADVSNYENPDIVMDFNVPVDEKYHKKFDLILDIGTLEHIFNIPQLLENIKLMLKPNGTIILGHPVSNAINHGFYQICPTLLYDYFSLNGFKNLTCFLIKGSNLNYEKKARVYRMKPSAMTENLILGSKIGIELLFFATKSNENYLQMKMPIQTKYKTSPYWQRKPKISQSKKRRLILWLLFVSRKWRPGIIDRTWKKLKTRKMLTYLGKY